MWSTEEALRPDFRWSAVVTPARARSPANYPRWSTHSYLSFGSEGNYTTGIIAHCLGSRVVGLASFTPTAKRIGYAVGHPMYFPISPDERIVSVWVTCSRPVLDGVFAGPCLHVSSPLPPFALILFVSAPS